jgi:hypothetical protein
LRFVPLLRLLNAAAGVGVIFAGGVAVGAGPPIVVQSPAGATSGARVVATVHGHPAAWVFTRGGATILRFDQSWSKLLLHAGTVDPGSGPYPYGPAIVGGEAHAVIAAFNGGFKLSSGAGGFLDGGRAAVPLRRGVGSVVIYRDGGTDIGAWEQGVPARGRAVAFVRQNLPLLISAGRAAGPASSCALRCWGATVGNVVVTARSALGISSSGQLLWAGGSALSPAALAGDLVAAGAARAVELDINPDWVAAYLYRHGGGGPSPLPVLPSQHGVAGRFLVPYGRDFFSVVAR